MVSTFEFRNQPKRLLDRLERAERFLMAMAVHQRLGGDRAERQREVPGGGLADQKLLEQQRLRADALRGFVGSQRQQFVAQRQQAARLQADDRHPARGERRVGRNQPVELGAGMIDQARREKGAPAAQRPAAIRGPWNVDAISAGDQHAQRGVEVFALVGAIEGVGEQHDLAAVGRAEHLARGLEHVAPPFRQRALRADAGDAFE